MHPLALLAPLDPQRPPVVRSYMCEEASCCNAVHIRGLYLHHVHVHATSLRAHLARHRDGKRRKRAGGAVVLGRLGAFRQFLKP